MTLKKIDSMHRKIYMQQHQDVHFVWLLYAILKSNHRSGVIKFQIDNVVNLCRRKVLSGPLREITVKFELFLNIKDTKLKRFQW